jgi:hypothetical protein
MYRHTQIGRLGLILWPIVALVFGFAWVLRDEPVLVAVMLVTGVAMVVVTLSFGTLTIQDEGDFVGISFGPLPLIYKRIEYEKIDSVERGRSRWIDGWGIHWVPGRGWTYNVWGFDCVTLTMGNRTLRLGTDDPEGLTAMLESKIEGGR